MWPGTRNDAAGSPLRLLVIVAMGSFMVKVTSVMLVEFSPTDHLLSGTELRVAAVCVNCSKCFPICIGHTTGVRTYVDCIA